MLRVFFQGFGKRGAAFHRIFDLLEHLFEGRVFLLVVENVQTLDDGKTRVDHRGKLLGEYDDVFIFHTRLHKGDVFEQILRLLFDLAGRDLDPGQVGADGIFAGRLVLSLSPGAVFVFPSPDKNRHIRPPLLEGAPR